MAFQEPVVLDTFSRADGAVGANYTVFPEAGLIIPKIVSEQVSATEGEQYGAYWSAAEFGPAVSAYIEIKQAPATLKNMQYYLFVRGKAEGEVFRGYRLLSNFPANQGRWLLSREESTLGASAVGAVTWGSGDLMGLEANGPKITAWRKPSGGEFEELGHVIDYGLAAAGFVGFEITGENVAKEVAKLDSFAGGTVTENFEYQQASGPAA